MKDWQSQAHVKWECKYHVVIVPKYREKKHFKKHRKAAEFPGEISEVNGVDRCVADS